MHLKAKLSKELKNGIEIFVDQAVFKLWIKTVKILFWSISQEPLGLLKFYCYFKFLGQFTIYNAYITFQKGVDNFEIEHKNMLIFGRWCSTPLSQWFPNFFDHQFTDRVHVRLWQLSSLTGSRFLCYEPLIKIITVERLWYIVIQNRCLSQGLNQY